MGLPQDNAVAIRETRPLLGLSNDGHFTDKMDLSRRSHREVTMQFLVLGKGKTGSLVAEVARERGHSVRALDIDENLHALALTEANLAKVDAVIDFTTPQAAAENIRAVLALGGNIVVGTTGWYENLDEMKSLAKRFGGGLLYGTNFSIGVQKLFRLTAQLAQLDGYTFSIDETHHVSKLDAPSGTAATLREIILAARPASGARPEVFIASHRVGDAMGEHIVTAVSDSDTLEIRHEIKDRRCLALGAVRGAEWLAHNSGSHDFRDIFEQL
ncbi:MAG: 4-hydroxy-tetrahydrodipicolinate reductase [Terracidiphilus sp.]|jgi:4-hydroxy-tetrahydrodipicolinate reductase